MAGGTFTARNKVRPGAYINFTSAAKPLGSVGERGTALLPMALSFGPEGEMITVTRDTDVRPLFGVESGDPSLLLLRECAKRAKTVLVWRLNSGEKASCTDGGLTVTARYTGAAGNGITVKVAAEGDAFRVETWLGGTLLDSQTAGTAEALKDNSVAVFSGSGALKAHAGLRLSGGSDGEAAADSYDAFFQAAARWDFNTMAIPSAESGIQEKAIAFVRRMREEEGKKIQAVLPENSAGYEGILSVKNGVILEDGTLVDKVMATAYLAGMTAGAGVNQSCTYDRYDGAVDVSPRLTESEIAAALKTGQLVFTPRSGGVILEQDQNTLISFTPEKGKAFHKNRTLRVLDQLAGDIRGIFEEYYLGKVANSADGRRLFQAELLGYLRALAEIQAIEPPESGDVTVTPGEEPDMVVAQLAVQPVDSMEKLYMTVVLE